MHEARIFVQPVNGVAYSLIIKMIIYYYLSFCFDTVSIISVTS